MPTQTLHSALLAAFVDCLHLGLIDHECARHCLYGISWTNTALCNINWPQTEAHQYEIILSHLDMWHLAKWPGISTRCHSSWIGLCLAAIFNTAFGHIFCRRTHILNNWSLLTDTYSFIMLIMCSVIIPKYHLNFFTLMFSDKES